MLVFLHSINYYKINSIIYYIIISKFRVDLPRPQTVLTNQALNYNVPLSNNVMPIKHNEYENTFTLMDPREQNQGT